MRYPCTLPEFVDDVLQISDAPCQPIDPGGHEGVFRPEKVEQDLELGWPLRRVPLAFSARITSQPAAFKVRRCKLRSWSIVETRA